MTWSTVLSPSPLLNSIPQSYTSVDFKVCSDDLEVLQNPKMPLYAQERHTCVGNTFCV